MLLPPGPECQQSSWAGRASATNRGAGSNFQPVGCLAIACLICLLSGITAAAQEASRVGSAITPAVDQELRASLAVWLRDELASRPAGDPDDEQSRMIEELRALRGVIPDGCLQEGTGGISLAGYVPPPGRAQEEIAGPPGSFAHAGGPVAMMRPHGGEPVASAENNPDATDPHLEVFARSQYPSARECGACHQQIFEEWAVSSHAYAGISPMFHAFEATITKLSQGTIGYFCMRCHAPVMTALGLDRTQPVHAGPHVLREGVTCIACHRVKYPYVKSNGERRIEPGNIHDPVYGSGDGNGNAIAVKYREFFKVRTDPAASGPSQPIHRRVIQFEELSSATFCMSCHQVAVQPGIKLEVVWDQYRASPACREGTTCQDCHMGRVPGRNEGYPVGPAAVVNNLVVNPERKHSNHLFYGPGYSVAHPGVYPFELAPDRWSFTDWQQFDWRAGWGREDFERRIAGTPSERMFPPVWRNADDRMDAREKIDRNLNRLAGKLDSRRQVLENGSRVDGPFFGPTLRTGEPLRFEYVIHSTNNGHNMPSGSLGAQPQIWVNVVLIAPSGERVWESGHLDSLGDLCDVHSADVTSRRLPLDRQLVNFQTKFLTTNIKGTDREMPLPVNVDVDQIPFLRPPPQPTTVINHPPLIRMEAHSLPPLGSRRAVFSVPGDCIRMPGTWRLSFRMRSRLEPMYFMRFCNATPEMIRMMQEWTVDFHTQSVLFEICE